MTKQLTKAEEQVMQILWEIGEGVVKDVIARFPDDKPAYTTVATVLKVLENKGFVEAKKIGNINLFFPLVKKTDYARFQFSSLLRNYFNGSFPKMATFFANENNLSIRDLEEMLKEADIETFHNEKEEE
ncbi:MAG: BlaI/MecI/CopY family transcriptional regulator [Prolixibacteraceae bacterium]|jgi:predicted transcriptional regulator|nr:BlaI/MecI/CopY family transcriptional regulator [Prolixibacteraceae bacterium]